MNGNPCVQIYVWVMFTDYIQFHFFPTSDFLTNSKQQQNFVVNIFNLENIFQSFRSRAAAVIRTRSISQRDLPQVNYSVAAHSSKKLNKNLWMFWNKKKSYRMISLYVFVFPYRAEITYELQTATQTAAEFRGKYFQHRKYLSILSFTCSCCCCNTIPLLLIVVKTE